LSHRIVTLRDVANEAGVHPATASRALNPDKRLLVNAETVERVSAAARKLGYVANPLAKALRGGVTRQIGVLVRTLYHPWVGYFMQGVDDALSAAGYNIWITYSGEGEPERTRTLIDALVSWRAGGLIIATGEVTDEVIAQSITAGMPVVLVARPAIDQVCSAVDADNEGGAKSAVTHLIRLGHRRIAAIAGPQSVPLFRARLRGFRVAMEEAELRADPRVVRVAAGASVEAGRDACRELLASAPDVTAIAAGNDYIAVGCYRALEEAGLSCPRDISVVGFDDLPLTAHLSPAMTTMHFPSHEMGREAAKLMLAQVGGDAPTTRTVLIGTELVPRESTAAPRDDNAPL
jgi:LacI family transcriptional regulator